MGLLDFLTGNNAAASPWGALYDAGNGADPLKAQKLAELMAAAQAGSLGGMGVNPDNLGTPAASVFGPQPSQAPTPAPATGFGSGATPFGFAGPGSMSGINPAMFAQPGGPTAAPAAPQAAPAPDLSQVNKPGMVMSAAPPQDAASPLAVGNSYQMPRVGAADDFEPDDEVPANAKPTQGVLPGGAAAPGGPAQPAPFSLSGASSGLGDRLMKGTRGFMGNMGAGPIGALMGGLGALVTGQSTDPTSIASEQYNATGQALLNKGASLPEVLAARNNPALQKALIDQYFGKDKFSPVTVKDTLGNESKYAFNTQTGEFKGAGAAPGAQGGVSAPLAGAAQLPENFDAKTRRDEAFIKALDPQTRQVVEAAYNGDNVPQGRNLQKYMPTIQRAIQGFDPSSYQARLAFNREMGSGKSGYGLQASGFQQALEHLGTLAQRYLQKGNVNGLGFPDLAHAANAIREHASNDQAGEAVAIANEGQQAAGEIGKLFSGSQGGGVHEREQTKGYLGNSRASGPEAAAGLESTLDLMMGGLSKLEQARDRAYDGNAPEKYNFLGAKQQAQIDKIRTAIAQLKSGAAAPSPGAPAAASPLPPGWSVQVR